MITPLPDAPDRDTDDAETYVAKANAMMAALVEMVPEMNEDIAQVSEDAATATAAAIAAEAAKDAALAVTDFVGLTSALLNLALGAQSFTMTAGLAFSAADSHQVALISLTNDAIRMTANITAYNPADGATTIDVTRIQPGSGSASGWAVMLKALEGLSPEQVNSIAITAAIAL